MQRTQIFGKAQPGATVDTPWDPPWNIHVADAVRSGDNAKLLGLIDIPGGRVMLRQGFVAGTQPSSAFARLCMHLGAIDSLRAVVAAAPDGVTLQDCCVCHVVDETRGGAHKLEVYSDMQLHEEAIGDPMPSSAALALALEYQPEHACITGHLARFNGASLHCQALLRAVTATDLATAAEMAACCELLLAKGAPISHGDSTKVSSAAGLLFGYRWQDIGCPSVMVPLIGAYVRAGLVELNVGASQGRTPLELALVACNGYAAAAAIDLGCSLAMPSYPEHPDPLALAMDFAVLDKTGECVALVTAALMRRRMGELAKCDGEAASVGHRRSARASL